MFLSPTNALPYYTYKMLKYTAKISAQNCNFSKVRHRLPDGGPNGLKHVGAIMRYFNCIF